MAKNTSSSAFRKIDVDQYNEDNYREEEQAELQSAPIGPDEAEVTALMNQYPCSIYCIWLHQTKVDALVVRPDIAGL